MIVLLDDGRRSIDQVGLVAPQLLDGAISRLEAQEAVRIVERAEQRLDRRLAGNAAPASTARGGGPRCPPRGRS